MSSTEPAARRLQDRAVLWSMGEIRATEVVTVACDALVAGLDSPALRILAACTRAEADYAVPDLLPRHSTNWASPSTQRAALPDGKPPREHLPPGCWPAN